MKTNYQIPALLILFGINFITAANEVVILSDKVGTEIDAHENRFYRIFPNEKNLISGQILLIGDGKYRLMLIKNIDGKKKRVRRYLTENRVEELKSHIDSQPYFTEKEKILMYEGMDFLRAEKILNEIYKPQFVKVTHSKNKSLKGTLIKFDKRLLYVQTATTTEVIDLDKLDKLSYRSNEIDHTSLRPFVTAGTSVIGFLAARVYNNQRPTIYNENGLARKDLDAYRQIFGVVLGLIFSSEVSDAISTLLTPTETLFLSEAEYEKQNY